MFGLLLLLILRGASIEFYIKSSRFRAYWLYLLAATSLSLMVCLARISQQLLLVSPAAANHFLSLFIFLFWFNFTKAYSYLFHVSILKRLGLIVGLLLSSTLLLSVYGVSVTADVLSLKLFSVRVLLVLSFVGYSMYRYPPAFFGKSLLSYLFFTNAFFLINRVAPGVLTAGAMSTQGLNHASFFVINIFSVITLPLILAMLMAVKRVFHRHGFEVTY